MRRLIFTLTAMLGMGGTMNAQTPSNLNELYVHQWVSVGEGGMLKGIVTEPQANEPQKLDKVKIAIVREGKIVKVAESDAKGEFSVAGVEPGSYSLVARGEGTLAAFSLQVLSAKSGEHLANSVDVRCVRPTGDKVKDILRSQVVPPYLARLVSAATRDLDPIKETRKFAESDLVVADNGDMVGQIGKPVDSDNDFSDMVVFVTSNGSEVARSKVEKDGTFRFAGLKNGTYGLVAAGQDGFAALSFQFYNPALATSSTEGAKLVSRRNGCQRLNVEVINCCDVQCCERPIETIQCEQVVQCDPVVTSNPVVSEVVVDPAAPAAPAYGMGGWGGGFGGGGSYGGGGGGGGIGGANGLIGIAGLAGLAAVIANQDDNNNLVPVPVVSAP